MNTSLIISSTKNGQEQQKSVTYVNPAATNANLKTFAQKITAMTNRTYYGATRVNKMDVNEADAATSSKTEPTLTIGSWSAMTYQEKNGVQADITYNGDGNLFANTTKLATFYGSNPIKLFVGTTDSFTGTLYASEGDTYAAKSVDFSRNA